MEDYTIFIKGIRQKNIEELQQRIEAFLEKYSAENKTLLSYDFSCAKESLITLWNDVEIMAGEDLYAVLLRHNNLGTGVCPHRLQGALLKLPRTDLGSFRGLIEEELCTIP